MYVEIQKYKIELYQLVRNNNFMFLILSICTYKIYEPDKCEN